MPRAKEGGRDVLRGGLRFFALFPSAVLLWAEQSPAPAGAIRPFCRGGALPRPPKRETPPSFACGKIRLPFQGRWQPKADGGVFFALFTFYFDFTRTGFPSLHCI